MDPEKCAIDAFLEGLEPDPELLVSEWADQYRVLSKKAAAEAGLWRTDRTPYLKEIMDCLSPSNPTKRVVFMKGSQIGGSECGFNWLGYIIWNGGGPTLCVSPTEDLSEKISKQRIQPMIDDTAVLRERVMPARSRDSGNTLFVKEFRGGMLMMVGANSAVGLRSMPIRNLYCTEISAYPSDVGGEGDPVQLAEKRTQTFPNRKIYLESTPGIRDSCRIEYEYLLSDQRRFYVPCPHCNSFQWLRWPQIKWDKDDEGNDLPETTYYSCEHCEARISELHKIEMLSKGQWRATAESDGRTIGFHLSSLYSPWKSWSDIADEFLKSRADAPKLKQFVNSILGETWEEEYAAKVGVDVLQARVESFEKAPNGVIIATCGVDVQDNRLAVSVYGWGRNEECWVISHQEIYGDPSGVEIWKQLDNIIDTPIPHETFGEIKIMATAIDSGGHNTMEVYQYARERQNKKVIAIKGQSQKGKPPIGKATVVDLNVKGRTLSNGARVYPVGSDTIKSVIYGRLKHNEPGAGYIHFHEKLNTEFFMQLTSEKLVTKHNKGFPVREWQLKKGERNEALDCAVYAYAALQFLYMYYNRKTIFDQFSAKLKDNKTNKPVLTDLATNTQTKQTLIKTIPRKNFVTGFK